jgi:ubiquinone/menaquinone biosynthesis C-methylase UbiE
MSGEKPFSQPDYGNWVPKKIIYVLGIFGLIMLGLSWFVFFFLAGAALFLVVFGYFVYARYKFSPRGGNIQAKIRELVLDNLDWDGDGQAIDIGCGNGPLTIRLAQKYPDAHVTGIDYWGGQWEYSQAICERNAAIEGVADRVTFQQGSASKLPVEDESFDAAVSNLVFHEVRDSRDKRDVIREALRVLKKGGKFAFQDLFTMAQVFGDLDDLLNGIRRWGVAEVEYIDTHESAFIPKALRLSFMVGSIGIIRGTK